jgi:hypothetical protein
MPVCLRAHAIHHSWRRDPAFHAAGRESDPFSLGLAVEVAQSEAQLRLGLSSTLDTCAIRSMRIKHNQVLCALDPAHDARIDNFLAGRRSVGADFKSTHPTDLSLTRGWAPAL